MTEDHGLAEKYVDALAEIKRLAASERYYYNLWLSAKVDILRLERENADLRADLDKPPQQRKYCAGCTLPGEVADLRAGMRKDVG